MRIHFKKLLLELRSKISWNKRRLCEWCWKESNFKLKRIYSKADQVGKLRIVCDVCVKNCCKGV